MEKDNKNKSSQGEKENKAWWQPAIFMFLRLSGFIAIPIIMGVFIGKWLDQKYDSEPWLFLTSVGAAFLISMIALVRNTMSEFKKIEKENKNSNIKNQKYKNNNNF